MEKKLTPQQISVLRTLEYGENVYNGNKEHLIREIDALMPGLIVIVPQIGEARIKPRFGTILSREGRRYLATLDGAKK